MISKDRENPLTVVRCLISPLSRFNSHDIADALSLAEEQGISVSRYDSLQDMARLLKAGLVAKGPVFGEVHSVDPKRNEYIELLARRNPELYSQIVQANFDRMTERDGRRARFDENYRKNDKGRSEEAELRDREPATDKKRWL